MIGEPSETLLVEGAIKRYLRAEGYTVKGGTLDGYLLVVSAMRSDSAGGYKLGVTGHVMVASLSWQNIGDAFVSDRCKGEHDIAQQVKAIVGTQITLIDGFLAQAPDEESLAEMLSTFANRKIRATSQKVTEFMNGLQEQQNREVYSPPVDLMR
jgi:hypothetical protein